MDENWASRMTPKIQQDARRLLGLREFPARTDEQKRALLGSDMRVSALNAIDTTTNPRRKREVKKGVVLEAIEKKLISDEVKQKPVVYIGSGTDVEYPLALGARNIVLVDPVFAQPEAVAELKKYVADIIHTPPSESENMTLQFDFDYGSGPESVTVSLVAKPYHHEMQEGDYEISGDTGGVILYASQGPSYAVQLEKNVWNKITPKGFILDEYVFNRRNQDTGLPEAIELGAP